MVRRPTFVAVTAVCLIQLVPAASAAPDAPQVVTWSDFSTAFSRVICLIERPPADPLFHRDRFVVQSRKPETCPGYRDSDPIQRVIAAAMRDCFELLREGPFPIIPATTLDRLGTMADMDARSREAALALLGDPYVQTVLIQRIRGSLQHEGFECPGWPSSPVPEARRLAWEDFEPYLFRFIELTPPGRLVVCDGVAGDPPTTLGQKLLVRAGSVAAWTIRPELRAAASIYAKEANARDGPSLNAAEMTRELRVALRTNPSVKAATCSALLPFMDDLQFRPTWCAPEDPVPASH